MTPCRLYITNQKFLPSTANLLNNIAQLYVLVIKMSLSLFNCLIPVNISLNSFEFTICHFYSLFRFLYIVNCNCQSGVRRPDEPLLSVPFYCFYLPSLKSVNKYGLLHHLVLFFENYLLVDLWKYGIPNLRFSLPRALTLNLEPSFTIL